MIRTKVPLGIWSSGCDGLHLKAFEVSGDSEFLHEEVALTE
jgi:hypothetical protein